MALQERIVTLLKRLGITLPEGWAPVTNKNIGYNNFGATERGVEVYLNPDFSLRVYHKYTDVLLAVDIPYEVMSAMYIETGRLSVSPDEYAHAQEEIAKYRLVLEESENHKQVHSKQAYKIGEVLKPALHKANERRRWHFQQRDKLKRVLAVTAARLHNARKTKQVLVSEISDLLRQNKDECERTERMAQMIRSVIELKGGALADTDRDFYSILAYLCKTDRKRAKAVYLSLTLEPEQPQTADAHPGVVF